MEIPPSSWSMNRVEAFARGGVGREWPTPSEARRVGGGGAGTPEPGQREWRRRRGGLGFGVGPETKDHGTYMCIQMKNSNYTTPY